MVYPKICGEESISRNQLYKILQEGAPQSAICRRIKRFDQKHNADTAMVFAAICGSLAAVVAVSVICFGIGLMLTGGGSEASMIILCMFAGTSGVLTIGTLVSGAILGVKEWQNNKKMSQNDVAKTVREMAQNVAKAMDNYKAGYDRYNELELQKNQLEKVQASWLEGKKEKEALAEIKQRTELDLSAHEIKTNRTKEWVAIALGITTLMIGVMFIGLGAGSSPVTAFVGLSVTLLGAGITLLGGVNAAFKEDGKYTTNTAKKRLEQLREQVAQAQKQEAYNHRTYLALDELKAYLETNQGEVINENILFEKEIKVDDIVYKDNSASSNFSNKGSIRKNIMYLDESNEDLSIIIE